MNTRKSIALSILAGLLMLTSTTFPRGGGRGGRSGGGRSAGGRTGGAGRTRHTGGRGGNHRSHRNVSHTTNVYGGGYGHGRYYDGGAWVAPVLATTAVIGAASAGAAASSASSANQAADSADRSARLANRAAESTNNNITYTGSRSAQSRPRSREAAIHATQSAQKIQARNTGATNKAVQAAQRYRPQSGTTTRDDRPRSFKVDGYRTYGFWNKNRFYATRFWGGVPYYWYDGFWTPWVDFWSLYPWWWSIYNSQYNDSLSRDRISFDECDNDYDCPDGDGCPPACDRYYD